MQSLTEKYRPRVLSEIRGQAGVVAALASYAASPAPGSFILAGDTGTGKTSAALALAAALGCRADMAELGGVNEIASGEQTAQSVRDMLGRLAYRPFYGSGWKVLIVNEADRMNAAVENIWLDALEKLPDKVTIVFTTNNLDSLADRFRDRCEVLEFNSDANTLRDAARELAGHIWRSEGMAGQPEIHAAKVIIGGRISFRRLVQTLAPMIRARAIESAPAAKSLLGVHS